MGLLFAVGSDDVNTRITLPSQPEVCSSERRNFADSHGRQSQDLTAYHFFRFCILQPYRSRHRQPLHPLGGLDLVAVTPVAAGVLHIVVEYELIHCSDHVEISFPRDVVGLQSSDFFHTD